MTQKEIDALVEEKIETRTNFIKEEYGAFKKFVYNVMKGMVLVIILQAGTLIYWKAVDKTNISSNTKQNETLAKAITEATIANNEAIKQLTEAVIVNKTNIDASKERFNDHLNSSR